jgi:ssDNA-binding Zn-finger/Zn-ribbon topoisomerase 1
MSIGWVKCPQCGEEYYIKHIKFPFKDDGSSLECLKCNTTLHRWGKGTDDYVLRTKEDMKKVQESEESRPTCVCGAKMTRRSGQNGLFWGCSRFPNCRHTQ